MDIKVCTTCKKEYPATSEYFIKDKKSSDGLSSMCKLCIKDSQKRSMTKKENRGMKIYTRVSQEEKEKIEEYAKDCGLDLSKYMRKVLLENAPIIVRDLGNYENLEKEVEQLSYFYKKAGNNINQIAKVLNQGGPVSASTIVKLIKTLELLDKKMSVIEDEVCSVYKKWQ